MNTQTQVWLLFGVISALSGILTVGLAWGIKKLTDFGKVWVILMSDVSPAWIGRVRMRGDRFRRKVGGVVQEFHPDGAGGIAANRSKLFIIHAERGWTLRAPLSHQLLTQAKELLESGALKTRASLQQLISCDPSFVYNKSATQSYKKWFQSQEDKPHWLVSIAPFMLIAIIILVAGLGFVVYQMAKAKGVA